MSKYSQALRNGARGNTQSRLGERNRRLNKWYINVANVCHGVATLRGANPLGGNTQSRLGERNRRLNKWYINVANVCHGVATLRGAIRPKARKHSFCVKRDV